MQALVDIGNTRIKWALYDRKRLGQHGNAVHRDVRDAALQTVRLGAQASGSSGT